MPEPKNRLTVVGTVYHQVPQGEPDSFESRFVRGLEDEEQPYRRQTKVGEKWEAIDFGWLESVGYLVIRNEAGKDRTTKPTNEEKAALAKKVLELTLDTNEEDCWDVLPGESFQGNTRYWKNLFIRSQSGVIDYTLYAVPR